MAVHICKMVSWLNVHLVCLELLSSFLLIFLIVREGQQKARVMSRQISCVLFIYFFCERGKYKKRFHLLQSFFVVDLFLFFLLLFKQDGKVCSKLLNGFWQ